MATANEISLGSGTKAGPTSTMVSEYETRMVRESPLKNISARFSIRIDSPSVTNRMFSSLPLDRRPIRPLYSR